MIRLPSAEGVIEVYAALAPLGAPRPIIRNGDVGLLESCIQRAETTVYGVEAYPSIHDKVAAIVDSISRTHPLIDGNKRLAYVVTVMVYSANGHVSTATASQADLYVEIARGIHSVAEIAARLRATWTDDGTGGARSRVGSADPPPR